MSNPRGLRKQAEINKLLHLLQGNEENFDFFERLSAEDLHRLFLHIQQAVQMEQAPVWERLGKVVRFMPAFINAKVAETAVGANITANITYHVAVKDAVGIAKYLSIPFLAEVSENLIPEKSQDIINGFPMDLMRKVIEYMIKKQSHYAIAGFVDYLEQWKVIELAKNIRDEKDLIRISVFVQNKHLLAELVQGFSDDKLFRTMVAAHELEEHNELMNIYNLLKGSQRARVIDIIEKRLPDYIAKNYQGL
jgi:hypothetical protein